MRLNSFLMDEIGTGWRQFYMEGMMPKRVFAVYLMYHGEKKVQVKDILLEKE